MIMFENVMCIYFQSSMILRIRIYCDANFYEVGFVQFGLNTDF